MKIKTARIITGMGILVLAVAAGCVLLVSTGKHALERAYEALEADGRPMNPEDIIPATIPGQDNAAMLYQAAASLLQAEGGNGDEDFLETCRSLADDLIAGQADEQARARFREILNRESVKYALEQVRTGTRREGCRYDLDYSMGADIPLAHIRPHGYLSRILTARALTAAEDGDIQRAWDEVATALRFADALVNQPFLISQLVRIQQFEDTVKVIPLIVRKGRPNEEQARELMSLLARFDRNEPWIRALDGERILFGEWVFGRAITIREIMHIAEPFDIGYNRARLLLGDHNHATYLNLIRMQTQALQAPYWSGEVQTLEEALEHEPRLFRIVAEWMLPSVDHVTKKHFAMVAKARMMRAAFSLLSQVDDSDGYPENFPAPKDSGLTMTDPFGGKPLVYKKEDSGFILYSVGPNLIDDGGVEREDAAADDIVCHFR